MKVGDLVELSAYGRNLKNIYGDRHDDVGLIVKTGLYEDTFTVIWSSDGAGNRGVQRRDIRLVKKRRLNK